MHPTREQLIEELEDLELDELADLLEDCDDNLYWWLSDLYPNADLPEGALDMLRWMTARYSDPHKLTMRLVEFIESDCALYSRTLTALGIPEDG